jgi:hypothetical protein
MIVEALAHELIAFLRSREQRVYALLDAARAPAILPLLERSGEPYECLYSGAAAAQLAHYAPYLLEVRDDCAVLEEIVSDGWLDAWGYFILSPASLTELRTHFRKFLKVELEDGESVYFRFYDPRVISAFLPTCTPAQAGAFLEPIDFLLCPAEDPASLLAFRHYDGKLVSREIPIANAAAASVRR